MIAGFIPIVWGNSMPSTIKKKSIRGGLPFWKMIKTLGMSLSTIVIPVLSQLVLQSPKSLQEHLNLEAFSMSWTRLRMRSIVMSIIR